jgi:thiamine biosynthesis protein ThiS
MRSGEGRGSEGRGSERSARDGGARIILNGEPHALPRDASLLALLAALELAPDWVLVELNGAPLARESYAAITLRDGDRVELATPMAGG